MTALRPARVGCSGWNYDDWRGVVYPAGVGTSRWLELYAERFDTVEVNATFYRLARKTTTARWAEQAPPGFVFAVKASRYLTHMKRLTDMGQGVRRFMDSIEPLVEAGCLGPIVWQLPESFHRDDDRLARALDGLPPGRHCFEFRHMSWFDDDGALALLRDHGVGLVIGDHPERPFQPVEATADFAFIRFHHGARGRRGNYSPSELDEWAGRIDRLRRTVEVFAYFNNDWEGFAPRNAEALRQRLR